MVELRRKSKPAPQPPASQEEWINRATADGAASSPPSPLPASSVEKKESTTTNRSESQSAKKLKTNPPPSAVKEAESPAPPPRYISFAMDTITLSLFRELSFTLEKGNVATLVHVIHACSQFTDEEFRNFPESRLVTGHAKRTMSFLLPQEAITAVDALARRLRVRNKSGLYRYLIHILAHSMGIAVRY